MIKKYLVVLIVLISGCEAANQTKGNGNSSSLTGSSSSTSFTATDNLPRLALVIGNSNYQNTSSLANPLNDADDMASVLRGLGFKVILKKDINHRSMKIAVNNFTQRLKTNKGIGLFYFSGHGLQDNNSHNYLIPVDADIKTPADIQYEAVNSQRVLDKMSETNNKLNLLILDACRDNLPEQNKGYIRKGLAAMKGSLGSLVAYATAPDTSALGSERKRNSVYTQYLVRALKTRSNLSVSDMLTYVTNKVSGETGNRQVPWQSGSMKDIFCFSRCGLSNELAERDAKIASLEAQLRASKQQQTIIPIPTSDSERRITMHRFVRKIAKSYNVDSSLICAIINQESGWNPKVISPVGAIGLMQIMPESGRSACNLRKSELLNPSKNIKCGVSYFKAQLVRFNSIELALCAYNAGPHRVKKYGKCPPFRETQHYKKTILAAYNRGNACRNAPYIIIDNFTTPKFHPLTSNLALE